MSQGGLAKRRIFGCRGDLRGAVAFSDGAEVITYVGGNNLVFHNTRTHAQHFIQGGMGTRGISAVGMSHDKRLMAVAEKGDRAHIDIWDVKTCRKRKTLAHEESAAAEIVSVCFSHEGDMLVAQGAEPDYTLVLWDWQKGKVLSYVTLPTDLPVYGAKLNPFGSVVGVTGQNCLRFYRISAEGESLQALPMPELEPASYADLAWVNEPQDACVVATAEGALLLYYSGQLECELSHNDGDKYTSLLVFSNGFFAAAAGGLIHKYVYKVENRSTNPENVFLKVCTYTIDQCPVGCLSMCLTDDEATLVAITEENQIYKMNATVVDTRESDHAAPAVPGAGPAGAKPAEGAEDERKVPQLVYCNFHGSGPVVGLDICLRKPLCVTVGKDRRIMVWNYMEDKLDQQVMCTEEMFSVSFHPSGLHLIVGFADRLRIMNILMDDIRTHQELNIKSCSEVRFSNGGHYFAAVTSANSICVFDFYTLEKMCDLRGHNAKVCSLFWSENDMYLLSAGTDGAIYKWDVLEGKRADEFVQKGVTYNCAIANKQNLYACSSDRKLKEIDGTQFKIIKELDCGAVFNQVALSRGEHVLFAGTTTSGDASTPGCLRVYSFPLNGDFFEFPCMAGGITKFKASYDDQVLFVVDTMGTVCLFDIRDRQDHGRLGSSGLPSGAMGIMPMNATFPWSEEILVTRTDLEERRTVIDDLVRKVDELEVQNEYQLRLKNMHFGEHVKEITEKYTQELEQDRNRYELLKEEKSDMEVEYEERVKQLEEKHQHELQELESGYQQRIMTEVERFQQLVHERNLQQARWEEQRNLLMETHGKYLDELTDDFERKLDEDLQLRLGLEDDLADLERDLEETKTQLEDDIDTEVQNLRGRFESRLQEERDETLRLKGENGIMKKKFTVLSKEIEDQKESIKDLQEKETDLHSQIERLRQEILSHKREIRSRDDTIGDKERKIYELKKKNQELEKFKFVLDYKIREIKRQIEPREVEIGNMKVQIKDMDHELEQFHKSNASLDVMIGELRTQLDSMQLEIMRQRKKIQRQNNATSTLKNELHAVATDIQDPEQLQTGTRGLLQKYSAEDADVAVEVDVHVAEEYERHREYLEETLHTLKGRFETGVEAHRSLNLDVMTNNMSLIKEINEQREKNRNTKMQLGASTSQMQHLSHGGEKEGAPEAAGPEVDEFPEATPQPGAPGGNDNHAAELRAVAERQRQRIAELQAEIENLEGRVIDQRRPYSRETLPVQV